MGKLDYRAIVAGVLIAVTSADALAQGHRSHPPMPDQQFFLQCQIEENGERKLIEVPLEMSTPTAPVDLDQVVELPAPLGALRLTRYLPRAELDQRVVPDESLASDPAVLLAIEGPTQSHQLWLLAGTSQRNQLTSLIGTWRYMAVADKEERGELFRQFKDELTRDPTLRVGRSDGDAGHELAVRAGATYTLDDLSCKVVVREFYPHFSFDKEAGKPVNRSDQRLNPAALVEIERDGKKEERWIFAKFPDFKSEDEEAVPLRVTLDCPLARKRTTPDFVMVTIGRSSHEVWLRHEDKITARPMAVDEQIDVPGSQYKFHIAQAVQSGRLIEEYRSSKARGTVAALQVATADASGQPLSVWLELGKQRVLSTGKSRLVVSFGPRQSAPAPGQHKPAP